MAEPEKLRLFVAVRVPAGHLRAVDAALGPQRERFAAARWIPVDNQHVTLKFLGWTTDDRLADIRVAAAATAASVEPGRVRLTTLGAFPSARRARVLWVGIDDPEAVMTTSAKALDDRLVPLGFQAEEREFHPHLTLARFKVPRPLPEDLPDVTAGLGAFDVDEIVLFRSRLHPKGARYEALDAVPLGSGR